MASKKKVAIKRGGYESSIGSGTLPRFATELQTKPDIQLRLESLHFSSREEYWKLERRFHVMIRVRGRRWFGEIKQYYVNSEHILFQK